MKHNPTFFSSSDSKSFKTLYDDIKQLTKVHKHGELQKKLDDFKQAIANYETKFMEAKRLLDDKKSQLALLRERYQNYLANNAYKKDEIEQTEFDINYLVHSINQENPKAKLAKAKQNYQELVELMNQTSK
jgi:chromosome segregation ATPase